MPQAKRPKARKAKSRRRPPAAARGGLDPVGFMLRVMRDEANDLGVRCAMAKAVAPFVHTRLASAAADDGALPDGPLEGGPLPAASGSNEAELARRIAYLLAKAMKG